jgi:hypothetical protein
MGTIAFSAIAPPAGRGLCSFWNGQKLAQAGFRLRVNRDEFLAAMTHFHDRHARSVPIQHLVACFFQNRLRQNRRPRTEIEYSPHFYRSAFLK